MSEAQAAYRCELAIVSSRKCIIIRCEDVCQPAVVQIHQEWPIWVGSTEGRVVRKVQGLTSRLISSSSGHQLKFHGSPHVSWGVSSALWGHKKLTIIVWKMNENSEFNKNAQFQAGWTVVSWAKRLG